MAILGLRFWRGFQAPTNRADSTSEAEHAAAARRIETPTDYHSDPLADLPSPWEQVKALVAMAAALTGSSGRATKPDERHLLKHALPCPALPLAAPRRQPCAASRHARHRVCLLGRSAQ
jgi:hypothetical protein